jgi:hypothetical protein
MRDQEYKTSEYLMGMVNKCFPQSKLSHSALQFPVKLFYFWMVSNRKVFVVAKISEVSILVLRFQSHKLWG